MVRSDDPALSQPQADEPVAPSLEAVAAAAERIAPHLVRTPVLHWRGPAARRLFGEGTEVWLKLELFQVGGSFKARGALNTALQLPPGQRAKGLTAFSSGNHAIAVAYAAQVLGVSAKVVMLNSANPARIELCRSFGAEILFAPDGDSAIEMVRDIQEQEGKSAIHPYDGVHTTEGAGTIALELVEQVPDLDAVLVSIGGGGLCSGLASTLKQVRPDCQVLAIEPEGADTMYRSFQAGHPLAAGVITTVADCLAPPRTLPYSYGLCRRAVDELALISDAAMIDAMGLLLRELKLVVEPGGAASTAAAIGPFRERIAGKRVAIVLCGSNIDLSSFTQMLSAGAPASRL